MKADSLRHRLSPKNCMKRKLTSSKFRDFLREISILPAFLTHEVGGAEAHEHGDAAAQRSVYVVVGAVRRQQRRGRRVISEAVIGVEVDEAGVLAVFGVVATVKQAAVGEGGHGEAEEEGEGEG